jgi:hypothetical protein
MNRDLEMVLALFFGAFLVILMSGALGIVTKTKTAQKWLTYFGNTR